MNNKLVFDVARGSFKTLAYHSLPNIECKKYKNLETKYVTTSPGLPLLKNSPFLGPKTFFN